MGYKSFYSSKKCWCWQIGDQFKMNSTNTSQKEIIIALQLSIDFDISSISLFIHKWTCIIDSSLWKWTSGQDTYGWKASHYLGTNTWWSMKTLQATFHNFSYYIYTTWNPELCSENSQKKLLTSMQISYVIMLHN